jgi:ADP-ribose diphosphatase
MSRKTVSIRFQASMRAVSKRKTDRIIIGAMHSSPKAPPRVHPAVLRAEPIARSRLFTIERLDVRFGNGREVEFERLRGGGSAVLVVPVKDDSLMLVREYAAGLERYELGFPKGRVEPGEAPEAAAAREVREEIGHAARRFTPLKTLSVSPGYSDFATHVILAEDLHPDPAEGDEPEPLEVVEWPLPELAGLLAREEFSDARSIAALYLLAQRGFG